MNEQTTARINDYPNFLECSIQTFNDQDKEDKSQSRILPMTMENLEKCVKLQWMLPYGIFFSVNPMESWKRNRESVKKIQTWICDIDTGTKEEQLELINKAPLKPSLVVESNHWFHLYYLANKDLTEEEFEKWNLGLKEYYNWDIKVCKDTARVLRIPWYYHMKWDKYMVNYRQDLSSKERYSVEQITKAYPYEEEKPKYEVKSFRTHYKANDIFDRLYNLDQMDLLSEFSWSSWVRWDTFDFKRNSNWEYQIWVNGVSTSSWIDAEHKIWSLDKWWPTIVQWVEWYYKGWVDKHELLEEIKARHPEIEDKKVEKIDTSKLVFNATIIPKLERPSYTRGNEELDNELWKLNKWQMLILCWETWAWKTTFATFMARKNKNCCYYVLEDKVENIAMRYAMKYAGITKEEYNKGTRWDEKQKRFEEWYMKFASRDIQMVDIGHKIQIWTLLDSMEQMVNKWIWLFFIDNLGFVIWEWQNEAVQTADVSSKLVSFCLEKNVCIVLLHHFKKRGTASDVRDIGQMRGSWKLGDDSFMVVEYMRDEGRTYLRVYKDRTRWDIALYEIGYNKWDFIFLSKEQSW